MNTHRRRGLQAGSTPRFARLRTSFGCIFRKAAASTGAIDYTLGHWTALTRHLDDGAVAIDNNHLEQQIKPWAMGRKAWMFVGSELARQRAAAVMSLVQSARLNGHVPLAYLRDVLQRPPSSSTTTSRSCCRIAGRPLLTDVDRVKVASPDAHVRPACARVSTDRIRKVHECLSAWTQRRLSRISGRYPSTSEPSPVLAVSRANRTCGRGVACREVGASSKCARVYPIHHL